jgi:hypothetical protein
LLLLLWPQLAAAAQVTAVVDRDRIAESESLNLELRVAGSPDDEPDLSPLDRDWEVLSRSQSSSFQIINADVSRSVVYSLTLMPRRLGEQVIPVICFGRDCSEPIKVDVAADNQTAAVQNDAEVLLEVEATPDRLYAQQPLLFKVRLLHRVDLQGRLDEPQPTGVDAVVEKLGDDRNDESRRNGRLYQLVERSYVIFPQTAGKLVIPELRFDGEIGRGMSRFDPFARQTERIRKRTRPITVTVTAPPVTGGRGWLPAREVTVTDDWQGGTKSLTVGEPATRTLTLTATGQQAAQLPELTLSVPSEFKSYPDQPSRDDKIDSAGITGVLQQKVVLVPTRPGRFRLPAATLDWWDVERKEWQQIRVDAVEVKVRPAPGEPVTAVPAPQPPPPLAPTSTPTPPDAPSPAPGQAPDSFWPWLCAALGFGWLATLLWLWWRRSRSRSRRVQERRDSSRGAARQDEKRLRRELLQAAREGEPVAARRLLHEWSRALWPEAGADAMTRLLTELPHLRAELELLDRSLYGKEAVAWSGDALLDAVAQWQAGRQKIPKETRLPELYPPQD